MAYINVESNTGSNIKGNISKIYTVFGGGSFPEWQLYGWSLHHNLIIKSCNDESWKELAKLKHQVFHQAQAIE